MFNIERAHFILDEMVVNGRVIDTNKTNVLRPLRIMDKFAAGK
jgi:AP-4 complex subunit sigma-1